MKAKRLLTLSQFAFSLSMHPDSVRRWANQGKIQYFVTKGGHRRFSELELNKIIRGVKTIA
jgi:predicted site-specific integrase-resolvase